MKWCHLQCHKHHVMWMLVTVASHDQKIHAALILIILPMASHDQRSYVTPHWYRFHLRNAIVPLMTLLVLHYASAGANGTT